jgi:flagellin
MQDEFDELATEIDRIVDSNSFNDINLLDNTSTYKISLGQGNSGSSAVSVTAQVMDASTLGVGGTYETATGPSVASTTTNYVTGDAAADALSFSIGGDALSITVGSGSMTLQEVADAINVESRGVQSGWNAATIEGDASTGYQLVLRAKSTGDVADLSVTNTGATAWASGVAGGGAGNAIATADFLNVDGAGTSLDISTSAAITAIDSAISTKDAYRAELGYKMNRLETAASVLQVQSENLSAAESRISDVDVASEMSAMTRNQVLAQAGIAMLGQANSMPQMALSLLKQ